MSQAKCTRCHATATADTFEEASKKLNHAIGLGRGIKCGATYDRVIEIKSETVQTPKKAEPEIETPNTEESKIQTPKKAKSKKEKYL